jgi:hypothetical protein
MKFWTQLLLSLAALASAPALVLVANGFAKSNRDPKQIQVSVIDSTEASKLFQEFAADPEIPFHYPIDGCYARATEMSKIADHDGVTMMRVYVEGDLQVKLKSSKYPLVRWGWHVAPAAYVLQADGKKAVEVFDPSLFSKPVSLRDWERRMLDKTPDFQPEIQEVYFGDRYQYSTRERENYRSVWTTADFNEVKRIFKQYFPLQDMTGVASAASTRSARGSQ